jgi:membrane protease YdiL (CAAX protease family)
MARLAPIDPTEPALPPPTRSGVFPRQWLGFLALLYLVGQIAALLVSSDPLADLRSPDRLLSRQSEGLIEFMDGMEALAQEAGQAAPLPPDWRDALLEIAADQLALGLGQIEREAIRRGDWPAPGEGPADAGADAAAATPEAGPGAAAPEPSAPGWSVDVVRLRLRLAALRHLRGDATWRQALDGELNPVPLAADPGASADRSATETSEDPASQDPAGSDSPLAPAEALPEPDWTRLATSQPRDPAQRELLRAARDLLSAAPAAPAAPAPALSESEAAARGLPAERLEPAPSAEATPLSPAERARRFDPLGEGLSASHLRRLAAEEAGLSELAGDVGARYHEKARDRAEGIAGRLGLFLLLSIAGGLFLLVLPLLRRERLWVALDHSPARAFGTADAWGIFGGYWLGFQLLAGLFVSLDPEQRSGLQVPLASLPLVPLAMWVARRSERNPFELLGLTFSPGRLGRLFVFALAATVLASLGNAALSVLLSTSADPDLWANPLLDLLINGDDATRRGLTLQAGLWAPIFEELAYRGVLFAGLRSRLPFLPAALASSLVFGLAHGYGMPGNLQIVWVGFVLCWSYERTRSLLPGILIHSLFNLSQLSVLEVYR